MDSTLNWATSTRTESVKSLSASLPEEQTSSKPSARTVTLDTLNKLLLPISRTLIFKSGDCFNLTLHIYLRKLVLLQQNATYVRPKTDEGYTSPFLSFVVRISQSLECLPRRTFQICLRSTESPGLLPFRFHSFISYRVWPLLSVMFNKLPVRVISWRL